MDALGDIGKAIVGAVLLVIAYPDNFVDIDPSDRMSIVVGLCLWAIIIAIGYAVYTVAK